jgi:hypothetical protein
MGVEFGEWRFGVGGSENPYALFIKLWLCTRSSVYMYKKIKGIKIGVLLLFLLNRLFYIN